jgi:2-dehydro-3-deoxyphosphogluconate aldolase / (4S)-4-hydroxy-2-oxoglutarate aldolase
MDAITRRITDLGVLPVIAIEHAEDAAPLAQALITGGLPCVEITFRTPAAEEAIGVITKQFPDMLVGGGTVLTIAQARKAIQAGADFIVTPGLDPEVVSFCQQMETPIFPGVMTPTELQQALNLGCTVMKFFPAEAAGGIPFLQALSGPFKQVKVIPLGGISPGNMGEYLALPQVLAVGGTWIAKQEQIAAGDFAGIEQRAREAAVLVQAVRRAR